MWRSKVHPDGDRDIFDSDFTDHIWQCNVYLERLNNNCLAISFPSLRNFNKAGRSAMPLIYKFGFLSRRCVALPVA